MSETRCERELGKKPWTQMLLRLDDDMPVSYTHLLFQELGVPEAFHVGAAFCDALGDVGYAVDAVLDQALSRGGQRLAGLEAVSYTHLDVYKRQG